MWFFSPKSSTFSEFPELNIFQTGWPPLFLDNGLQYTELTAWPGNTAKCTGHKTRPSLPSIQGTVQALQRGECCPDQRAKTCYCNTEFLQNAAIFRPRNCGERPNGVVEIFTRPTPHYHSAQAPRINNVTQDNSSTTSLCIYICCNLFAKISAAVEISSCKVFVILQ